MLRSGRQITPVLLRACPEFHQAAGRLTCASNSNFSSLGRLSARPNAFSASGPGVSAEAQLNECTAEACVGERVLRLDLELLPGGIPTGLRLSNNLLFGTHRARGRRAGTKVQDNPLTINNKVTTALYPNLPSLSQILHAGLEAAFAPACRLIGGDAS